MQGSLGQSNAKHGSPAEKLGNVGKPRAKQDKFQHQVFNMFQRIVVIPKLAPSVGVYFLFLLRGIGIKCAIEGSQ